MADKDYYKLLEVERGATADELKKAYRKLAMKYHPDQNKDDPAAEAKFKEINEAYDILKDPQKRAAYDQFGAAGVGGGGRGGFNASDFGGFGDAFSDIFEGMFGGGGARRNNTGPARGADMQYTLEISLEDAYNGKEATIRVPTNESCDKCDGSGAEPGTSSESCETCGGQGRVRMQQGFFTIERGCPTCGGAGTIIKNPCKKCGGHGRVRKEKTLKVKIPAGIDSGRRIRLAGEGEAGMRGGTAGDLYVLTVVKPHKFFRRDGANLHCRVPIPMTTAALGGEIDVPGMDKSSIKVKIPAGTQGGQQLRLRAKGMPVLRSEAFGDLYIEVHVETPVNLTGKQKELLKQLDATMGGKAGADNSPESSGFVRKVKELWNDLTD